MKKFNIPFRLQYTNYTTELISDKAPEFNTYLISELRSEKTFFAYQKIKTDLLKWTANEIPEINRFNQIYFEGGTFEKEVYFNCINIDLTSAYLTILLNDGFISPETFRFVNSLPKTERLVSVGMLAGRKKVFHYFGNDIKEVSEIRSPFESVFFYCVERTSEILRNCRLIAGDLFIFSWVDGIYFFDSPEIKREICEYLDGINFKYKIKDVKKIAVESQKNCTILKVKEKEGDREKPFFFPKEIHPLKTEILSLLKLI